MYAGIVGAYVYFYGMLWWIRFRRFSDINNTVNVMRVLAILNDACYDLKWKKEREETNQYVK